MLSEKQMDAALSSPLLRGLDAGEAERLLEELHAYPVRARRGEILIEQGQARSSIHIVLSGAAVGEKLSPDGTRTVINEFAPGGVFGDMLSGGGEESPVAVRMTENGEVLRIAFSDLLAQSTECAAAREAVLRNLFQEISQKYFALMRRLDMLLCPTLRGKIAKYLLAQSQEAGSISFSSPHSREEQAEILCCERSALSRELSRMRAEGLLDVSGRHFQLLKTEKLREYAE